MSLEPPLVLLPEPTSEPMPVPAQLFYQMRLRYLAVPMWRDDPSYFWAAKAKRRREIPT